MNANPATSLTHRNPIQSTASTSTDNKTNIEVKVESGMPRVPASHEGLKGKDLFHARYVEHFITPTSETTIDSKEESDVIFELLEKFQSYYSKCSPDALTFEELRDLHKSLNSLLKCNEMMIKDNSNDNKQSELQHILTAYADTLGADDKHLNKVLDHLLKYGQASVIAGLNSKSTDKACSEIGKLMLTLISTFLALSMLPSPNHSHSREKEILIVSTAAIILLSSSAYCLKLIYNMINTCCFNGRVLFVPKPKQN